MGTKAGKRGRGRPWLGPRVMVKLYVRPDTAASLRDLAQLRAVPVNFLGQAALDAFFALLVSGGDDGSAPSDEAAARRWMADRSAEREIERLSMGVPRT